MTYSFTPDRYVDNVGGNNANNGLSSGAAWKTLAKVNALGSTTGANLKIGLLSGVTWNEAFTVPASGMTFGIYGGTSPAIIDGTGTGPSSIGILDQKVGTQWYDLVIRNFGNYCMLVQPVAGSTGFLASNLEVGPNGAGQAQGINISNTDGVIDSCYIHGCWDGVAYPSGHGFGIVAVAPYNSLVISNNLLVSNYVNHSSQGALAKGLVVHHNRSILANVNGLDFQGGTSGFSPKYYNNFIYHRPTGTAGHGLDVQSASVGPIWRNNIVISDFTGTPTNVELYCLSPALSSLPGTDIDYNLGFLMAGCTSKYGQINGTLYDTLATFRTAVQGTFAGAEAHGLGTSDPLITDLAGGTYTLKKGSPAIDAGAVVSGITDGYFGTAPDMGYAETNYSNGGPGFRFGFR